MLTSCGAGSNSIRRTNTSALPLLSNNDGGTMSSQLLSNATTKPSPLMPGLFEFASHATTPVKPVSTMSVGPTVDGVNGSIDR